jgi:hypothetical protein
MDDDTKALQAIFQKNTPILDNKRLLISVKKQREKERLKARLELALGLCVSTFIVYLLIAESYSVILTIVLLGLAPIPIGFSFWAFKARAKKSSWETLDIEALIEMKKQQAITKVHYWRVSGIVISVLWSFLLIYFLYSLLSQQDHFIALIQIIVQLPILVLVWLRFLYLRGNLGREVSEIKQIVD